MDWEVTRVDDSICPYWSLHWKHGGIYICPCSESEGFAISVACNFMDRFKKGEARRLDNEGECIGPFALMRQCYKEEIQNNILSI